MASAYRTTFGQSPTTRQHAAIVQTVTDLDRWQRVLDDWLTNAWRAQSVGKMLDRYQHLDREESYGARPRPLPNTADRRNGRPSAAPTPDELARFLNRPRPDASRPSA